MLTLWVSDSSLFFGSGEFLRISSPNISAACFCNWPQDSSRWPPSLSPYLSLRLEFLFYPLMRPLPLVGSPFSSSIFSYFSMISFSWSELSRSNEPYNSSFFSFLVIEPRLFCNGLWLSWPLKSSPSSSITSSKSIYSSGWLSLDSSFFSGVLLSPGFMIRSCSMRSSSNSFRLASVLFHELNLLPSEGSLTLLSGTLPPTDLLFT